MSRALVILHSEAYREKAMKWVRQAPLMTRIDFRAPQRSLDQNARLWAMLTEVADQCRHHGLRLSADDWKRLFMDQLDRELRLVPNLDGNGFVSLGQSTSKLSKQEMSDLMELIAAYGAAHDVEFKDPAERAA